MSTGRHMDTANTIYKHYSALKKEILPFTLTLMDLEDIMRSEIGQTRRKTIPIYVEWDGGEKSNIQRIK
jgi:hypothetical protein